MHLRFLPCILSLLVSGVLPPPTRAAQSGETPGPAAEHDEIQPSTGKVAPGAEQMWAAVKLFRAANLEAGRAALQAAADKEYAPAQVLLANCLLAGSYGFERSPRKAVNLLRLAAERGSGLAMVSLGSCYVTGTGVYRDFDKAQAWLLAALKPEADFRRPEPPPGAEAEAGYDSTLAGELATDPEIEAKATANLLLGQIMLQRRHPAEAHSHFLAAAEAGPEGRYGLQAASLQAALNFAFGRGTTRDMARASAMLDLSKRQVARQGVKLIHNNVALKLVDEFAAADLEEQASTYGAQVEQSLQYYIAQQFSRKDSKDYNAAEAVKWYELAAESGQVWAMLNLAFIYQRGELGQPDPAKAFAWFERAGGPAQPQRHDLATANLALCHLHGYGTPKDPEKALALFRRFRDQDFICYLGSIGQAPPAPVTFEEALKLNQEWARRRKDPQAIFLLGLRQYFGAGVTRDLPEAVDNFRKAAKAGNPAAQCQLGLLYEYNPALLKVAAGPVSQRLAAEQYRQASTGGNVDGLANYATMLMQGRGVVEDRGQAEALYRRCLEIDPDHARAHHNLAVLLQRRQTDQAAALDVNAMRAEMLQHYERAAALKLPYAPLALGALYYEGRLVPRDYRKAYNYFEQAASAGMAQANFNLGYMHELGQGVPVTLTEAAYRYRLAGLEGHVEALRRLANFYLTGEGVAFDADRALFWLGQLAARGYPRVFVTAGDVLLAKGDYPEAVKLFRKLSESKDPYFSGYGYIRLSTCYERGYGVKPNPTRAERYFQLALKAGNSDALATEAMKDIRAGRVEEGLSRMHAAAKESRQASFYLGQMYFFGTNVPKDERQAIKYLRSSAEGNYAEALYFLAGLTYNEHPLAPTLDEAIQFARRAETAGLAKAADIHAKLRARRNLLQPAKDEQQAAARAS